VKELICVKENLFYEQSIVERSSPHSTHHYHQMAVFYLVLNGVHAINTAWCTVSTCHWKWRYW